VYIGTDGIALGRIGSGTTDSPYETPFSVTSGGMLTAKRGTIGGWTIGNTYIGNADTLTSCNMAIRNPIGLSNEDGRVVFFAGHETVDNEYITNSKFSVTKGGKLRARDAVIQGTISAEDGEIGDWTIDKGLKYQADKELSAYAVDEYTQVSDPEYYYQLTPNTQDIATANSNGAKNLIYIGVKGTVSKTDVNGYITAAAMTSIDEETGDGSGGESF